MAASVLLITNHDRDVGCPGAMDALRGLVTTGELSATEHVHAGWSRTEALERRNARVVQAIAESRSDIVMVLSLKDAVTDMDGVEKALSGRPVLYWEGDPWGRGKRIPDAMRRWLSLSQVVFSVGGDPQSRLLRAACARHVQFIPHTYDHVLFSDCEGQFVWGPAPDRVGFVGSNLMKAPLISGLPGSWQRFDLVRRLRGRFPGFRLAGPGWPPSWSQGAIAFADQVGFLQSCRVLAAWDHYPLTTDYTSDRMVISMIAGRAQVSTRHPGMDWAPGPEQGVELAESVAGAVDMTELLMALDDEGLRERGHASWRWVNGRMDHRTAFRHMLSVTTGDVAAVRRDPWDRLPAI